MPALTRSARPAPALLALSRLVARTLRPFRSRRRARPADLPPAQIMEPFRDAATWAEVRALPPYLLRDIGFYD